MQWKMGKGLNRHFADEDIQVGPLNMKRGSTSLITEGIKVKVTRGYHDKLTRKQEAWKAQRS